MTDKTLHKGAPRLVGEVTLPERITPVRAYIHQGNLDKVHGTAEEAADYFCRIYNVLEQELGGEKDPNLFQNAPYDFALAMIWAEIDEKGEPSRNADFFAYHGVDPKNWTANIEWDKFVYKNGIYDPFATVTCEDGAIVLGEEGKYRRTTKSLAEYMATPPSIAFEGVSRAFHCKRD